MDEEETRITPRRRGMTRAHPPAHVRFLTEASTIDGEEVVPVWSLPVAALLAPRWPR